MKRNVYPSQANRVLAASRNGRAWWEADASEKRGPTRGNRRRTRTRSHRPGNRRRITALLRDIEVTERPMVYRVFVCLSLILALARARDVIPAPLDSTKTGLVEPPTQAWMAEADSADAPSMVAPGLVAEGGVDFAAGLSDDENTYLERELDRSVRSGSLSPLPENGANEIQPLATGRNLDRLWRRDRSYGGSIDHMTATPTHRSRDFSLSGWHGGAAARGGYLGGRPSGSIPEPDISTGPLAIDLVGFASLEYTDNHELTASEKVSGVLLAGGLNASGRIDLTEDRQFNFNIGIGADQFIGESGDSDDDTRFHVTPDTFVDLNTGFGDLSVQLYDRFQQNRNREQFTFSPDRIDRGDYWENSIGAIASYPLNDAISAQGFYDFSRQESLSDEFDEIDSATHSAGGGLFLSPNDEFTVGLTGQFTRRHYDQGFNNDGDGTAIGLVARVPLTEFTEIEASGGWQRFSFNDAGTSSDLDDLDDYFATIAIKNELNDSLTHSVSLGRQAEYGTISNFESFDSARYELDLEVSGATRTGFMAEYRSVDESGPRNARDERFTMELFANHQLSDSVTLGVSGAITSNDGNHGQRSYEETRLQGYARLRLTESTALNLSYQRWQVEEHPDGFVENSFATGLSFDF